MAFRHEGGDGRFRYYAGFVRYPQNFFWRFVVKTLLFFLLVAVIFFSLVYLEIFSVRMQTLGDLIVSLQASQKSISLDTGESANVTFFMRSLSRIGCFTECNLSFVDASSSIIVDETLIQMNNSLQEYIRSYSIQAPKYGEGQVIYSFSARCQNVYSKSCPYNNTIVHKTSLITLDYKLPEEFRILKPGLKQKLENLLNEYSEIEVRQQNLGLGLSALHLANAAMDDEFEYYKGKINSLIELWNQQRYDELNRNINLDLSQLSEDINSSFSPIREFNLLIDYANRTQSDIPFVLAVSSSFNLTDSDELSKRFYPLLESLSSRKLDAARGYKEQFDSGYLVASSKVSSLFDSIISDARITANAPSLKEKLTVIQGYCRDSGYLNASNETMEILMNDCEKMNSMKTGPISDMNLSRIPEDFNLKETKFTLNENLPICCIFGKCSACCLNASCSFTPLLLVHGHRFNDENSPDYSVVDYELLQEEFEKHGYINAGTITPASGIAEVPEKEWGLTGNSLSVTATYYGENGTNQSISNYASILNDEIELIKFRTGQRKVDIMAFSMGGLVVRRYLQMYGEDSVDKFIMVGVPNNGTSGAVSTLCPVFGSETECSEMQTGSPFMSELRSYMPKDARLYGLVGSGCMMDNGEDGDGIVELKSAVFEDPLDPVKIFKINGNCPSTTDPLHLSMLRLQAHPETFQKILEILKE